MDNTEQIAEVLAGILREKHIPAFAEFTHPEENIPTTRTFVTLGTQAETFGEAFRTAGGDLAVPVQPVIRLRMHASGENACARINALWYDEILPALGAMHLKITALKADAPAYDHALGFLVREVRITVDAMYIFTEEVNV